MFLSPLPFQAWRTINMTLYTFQVIYLMFPSVLTETQPKPIQFTIGLTDSNLDKLSVLLADKGLDAWKVQSVIIFSLTDEDEFTSEILVGPKAQEWYASKIEEFLQSTASDLIQDLRINMEREAQETADKLSKDNS